MNKTKLYKAFGLVIESVLPIPQIPEAGEAAPDVRIVPAKLRGIVDPEAPTTAEGGPPPSKREAVESVCPREQNLVVPSSRIIEKYYFS